jgi:hypothetical protein
VSCLGTQILEPGSLIPSWLCHQLTELLGAVTTCVSGSWPCKEDDLCTCLCHAGLLGCPSEAVLVKQLK